MTLFWLLCAALLLVAMLFVVFPLWRKSASANDVLRDAANLGILRDQSAEMETDLRNGLLTQEAYEQGKHELQARLIEEVKISELPVVKLPRNPARILAVVLAVMLPLASISLYFALGNIDALNPQEASVADADGIIRSEEGLKNLERKLKRMPKNPNDWWTLARSYTELKRFPEAVKAYQQLVNLVPGEAQLWANYADVYAMAHGQSLLGDEVAKFLAKALELDANNLSGLAMSGSAAMERQDYAVAISHWKKLLSLVPAGSEDAQMFNSGIQQASQLLLAQPGGKEKLLQIAKTAAPVKAAVNQGAAVSGKVTLSPALAGKVSPTDTVFILARATQGPKMPLAVLRVTVKDLPMQFTLDDSMAMQPQFKISSFEQVVVVARVSKSGTPMSQSGDMEGLTGAVKPGSKGLNIVIDTVVP